MLPIMFVHNRYPLYIIELTYFVLMPSRDCMLLVKLNCKFFTYIQYRYNEYGRDFPHFCPSLVMVDIKQTDQIV